MSLAGSFRTAFMTEAIVAITALGSKEGDIHLDNIPDDEFPHIQAYGMAMQVAEELPFRIEKQLHAFTVVISDRNVTEEAMQTHFDDIQTRLDVTTKRTLDGLVKWIKITGNSPGEVVNDIDDSRIRFIEFEVVVEYER